MLVLSRKPGQTICINGNEIEVTVVEIEGNQVRLGIKAPTSVTILRAEIAGTKPPNSGQSGAANSPRSAPKSARPSSPRKAAPPKTLRFAPPPTPRRQSPTPPAGAEEARNLPSPRNRRRGANGNVRTDDGQQKEPDGNR